MLGEICCTFCNVAHLVGCHVRFLLRKCNGISLFWFGVGDGVKVDVDVGVDVGVDVDVDVSVDNGVLVRKFELK